MSNYSSFLIRCWTKREGAEPKYVIEHVQSGQQFRTSRLGEACAWIESVSERPPAKAGTHGEQPGAHGEQQ